MVFTAPMPTLKAAFVRAHRECGSPLPLLDATRSHEEAARDVRPPGKVRSVGFSPWGSGSKPREWAEAHTTNRGSVIEMQVVCCRFLTLHVRTKKWPGMSALPERFVVWALAHFLLYSKPREWAEAHTTNRGGVIEIQVVPCRFLTLHVRTKKWPGMSARPERFVVWALAHFLLYSKPREWAEAHTTNRGGVIEMQVVPCRFLALYVRTKKWPGMSARPERFVVWALAHFLLYSKPREWAEAHTTSMGGVIEIQVVPCRFLTLHVRPKKRPGMSALPEMAIRFLVWKAVCPLCVRRPRFRRGFRVARCGVRAFLRAHRGWRTNGTAASSCRIRPRARPEGVR